MYCKYVKPSQQFDYLNKQLFQLLNKQTKVVIILLLQYSIECERGERYIFILFKDTILRKKVTLQAGRENSRYKIQKNFIFSFRIGKQTLRR